MKGLPIRCTVPAVIRAVGYVYAGTDQRSLGYLPELEDTVLLYGGEHEPLRIEVRPIYRDGSRGDWQPLPIKDAPNGNRHTLLIALSEAGVDAVLPTQAASRHRIKVVNNGITGKWEVLSFLPGYAPQCLTLSEDCGAMLFIEAALGSGVCFPVHSGGIIE